MPSKAAALAPGNDISDSVWPAKASRRTSITHPASPAATATIEPAASALSMKWYSRTSPRSWSGFHVSVVGVAALAPMGSRPVLLRVHLPVGVAVMVMRRRIGGADDDQPA